VTDLEADVDEPNDFADFDSEMEDVVQQPKPETKVDEEKLLDGAEASDHSGSGAQLTPPASNTPLSAHRASASIATVLVDPLSHGSADPDHELADAMADVSINDPLLNPQQQEETTTVVVSPNAVSQPMPINTSTNARDPGDSDLLSPDRVAAPECPMTPRNDVGPFVLDGSASRTNSQRQNMNGEVVSGDS
jgi:E3 ubiquitin-protein ligase DMA1/2